MRILCLLFAYIVRITCPSVKNYNAYIMRMPYAKLAPELKRVRLNLNLDPKTVKKLREMSQEGEIPMSRVVDGLVLGESATRGHHVPGSVDIDAVIAKLRAKK